MPAKVCILGADGEVITEKIFDRIGDVAG